MTIRDNKNIKHDIMPWILSDEGYERFKPEHCILERFNRVNDKFILYFKNGSQAIIKAINIEGGREMDLFEEKLNDFLESSYEEILNANF